MDSGSGEVAAEECSEEHASPGGEKAWPLQREVSGAVTKPGAAPVAVSANPPYFLGGPSDELCFPPRVLVPHQPGHQWPLGFRQHGLHRAVPGVGREVPFGAGGELRQGQDPAQTDALDGGPSSLWPEVQRLTGFAQAEWKPLLNASQVPFPLGSSEEDEEMQFAEPSMLAVGHPAPALAEGDLGVGDAALLGAGAQAGPVCAGGAQQSRCATLAPSRSSSSSRG